MSYKYQPGRCYYMDAIVNHRKHQMTGYVRKGLKWRVIMIWLNLVKATMKLRYKWQHGADSLRNN